MGVARLSLLALGLSVVTLSSSAGAQCEVNWARGQLVCRGAAVGDLRAPSRSMARVKAERQARSRAHLAIVQAAQELPLAGGGKVGNKLDKDALSADSLLHVATDFGSDGSVVVHEALGLERVRALLFGARDFQKARKSEEVGKVRGKVRGKVLVVDGSAFGISPALGYTIGEKMNTAPVLFVSSREEAEKRSAELMGAREVMYVEAQGLKDDRVELPRDASGADAAAVIVVGTSKERGKK